jgi:chorismate mutase
MDRAEALKLLQDSRWEIDKLDEDIIKLIKLRTSLAVKIAQAKNVLDLDVEDKEREEYIQHKIRELARENEIDKKSLIQIIKILTDLSKQEQQKILRR